MNKESFLDQLKQHFHYLTGCQLMARFGDEGITIYFNYVQIFEELLSQNAHLMPNDLAKRHGINSIFVLAIDKALTEKQVSFDELKKFILDVYRTLLTDQLKQQKEAIGSSENPWKAFVESTKKGNDSLNDNEFFALKMIEVSDTCFGFDLHRCIYYEILEQNGRPDLGPILCEYDWLFAKAIEKWITFERLEAIAQNSDKCTFRYYPKNQSI